MFTRRIKTQLKRPICAIFIMLALVFNIFATPHPISFCIPEIKITENIPIKERDFAFLIPGDFSTYIYNSEEDYYLSYKNSYYAFTTKKGGWDCLRHYEILANGCIPFFTDLDKCYPNTLYIFPKELVSEAMNLEGVSKDGIDHRIFNPHQYNAILSQLLEYTRKHLTTKAMAAYVLEKLNYKGSGKILYLSGRTTEDYLRCLLLIGFKELLQEKVVDYPKIDHIYKNFSSPQALYGKGFTYTRIVDDLPIDRDNIEERIRAKEFDLVIYGSVHRGLPFHDLVTKIYNPDHIAYFCGEDEHTCEYFDWHNLFLREFP